MWGKGGEVGFFAGFDPDRSGQGAGLFVFFHKFGGNTGGAEIIVAPAGDAGGLGGVGGKSGGAVVQPAGDFRRSGQTVGETGDLGRLFRPERVALGGKKRFLIPAQKPSRGAKKGEFLPSGTKFLECFWDGRHRRMMKQEKVPWNIFLPDLVGVGCGEPPVPGLSF